MNKIRESTSLWNKDRMSGKWRSERYREDQEVLRNLKKVSSGPEVFPKSSMNAAFRISSKMWKRHASQRICRQRSSCRRVQQPLWIPVLELVVSNPQAMIFSAIFQASSAALTASASTLPVELSFLTIPRIWFSCSWATTITSLGWPSEGRSLDPQGVYHQSLSDRECRRSCLGC